MARVIDVLSVKAIFDASQVAEGVILTKKEMSEAAKVMKAMQTPLDALFDKEARLDQLLKRGALSAASHAKALHQLRTEYNNTVLAQEKEIAAAAATKQRIAHEIQQREQLRNQLRQQAEETKRLAAAERQERAADRAAQHRKQEMLGLLGAAPGIGGIFTGVTSSIGAMSLLNRAVDSVVSGFRDLGMFVIDSGKRIDEVADSADRLGLSVGAMSELKEAAKFADVSFDAVQNGMNKMLISIADAAGDPGSEKGKLFKRLGLDPEVLMGLEMPQQIRLIANEIAELSMNADRTNAIATIFGKGGKEMKLLLEDFDKFKQLAQESGAIITERDAQRIAQADDAMKKLDSSTQKLGNTVAVGLAPTLAKAADALAEIAGNGTKVSWLSAALGLMFPSQFIASGAGVAVGQSMNENNALAKAEQEARDAAGPTDAQREMNQAILDRDQAEIDKKLESEAAKHAERIQGDFDKTRDKLKEEIFILQHGTQAWKEHSLAMSEFSDVQYMEILALQKQADAHKALEFAEQQDAAAKKDRLREAETIRSSFQTAEELAAIRLSKAMDLATLGEAGGLTPEDVDKMAELEAKKLFKPSAEFRLGAKTFGSQEAIAATLGARQSDDSQRLESIKQSLLEIARRPPIQVEEVPAL